MKGKGEYFGTHRVIEPQGLLPQAASKVDNDPEIWSNEILIDVIALQPTATAINEIKKRVGDDKQEHSRTGRRHLSLPDGKRHPRNVYAHSEEECEAKLAQLIREMKAEIAMLKAKAKWQTA